MAKSQHSFSKYEKEKMKQKKREEKQKRKEARKAEKSSGIDFAYVDHEGNLTDTPPDPELKPEIDPEEIVLGVPPQNEDERPDNPFQHTGKVAFYNTSKGFGFITDDVNGEKYFTHVSGLIDEISENDAVSFELERGQKGMNAVNVKKI